MKPIEEYLYCAVNKQNEIVWVCGSSQRTRYFKTDRYLSREVEYHNKYHEKDSWRVAKFKLIEVET